MLSKNRSDTEIARITQWLLDLYPSPKQDLIHQAIDFVSRYTHGRLRKNGEPEIIHPLKTAETTALLGLGHKSICAALLHDMLEDFPEDATVGPTIAQVFGREVLDLVTALSIIRNNPAEMSPTRYTVEAQQYVLASVADLRVIIIKLADKLHNLETIAGLTPERQAAFLQEIERLYLPMAEYLGLGLIHTKMDSTCFRAAHPEEYHAIERQLAHQHAVRSKSVEALIQELHELCAIAEVHANIEGRLKSIPSIYRKQLKHKREGKKYELNTVFDVLAFRIICSSVKECYSVSSSICTLYELAEHTTDDYIARPKPNGYRSIHLVPIHPMYGPFEVQIKTAEMHEYNEYGPASHIKYKQSGSSDRDSDQLFSWTHETAKQLQSYSSAEDHPISIDLFRDHIFILTPEMDFIKLPLRATPIDVAYHIHTHCGNQCTDVLVNNRPVKIDTILKTGDVVEIKTNPKKKYASESWLEFVVTGKARNGIRRSIRRRMTSCS